MFSGLNNIVLVLGAGATVSEFLSQFVENKKKRKLIKPPVDTDFLQIASNVNNSAYARLERMFNDVWEFKEVYPLKYHRMEDLFSHAYFNFVQEEQGSLKYRLTENVYVSLIELLRSTISDTTKIIKISEKAEHWRIVKILRERCTNFTIISFNYDVVIDRTLWELSKEKVLKWSPVNGYGFNSIINMPKKNIKSEVLLLKLHGSINWYVLKKNWLKRVREKRRSENEIIYIPRPSNEKGKHSWIRARKRAVIGNKRQIILPFIIPPIFEKTPYFNEKLSDLWNLARDKLEQADLVIVWGYSMPRTDLHAESLFWQTAKKGNYDLVVINPDMEALSRVTQVCGHNRIMWFFKYFHFEKYLDKNMDR